MRTSNARKTPKVLAVAAAVLVAAFAVNALLSFILVPYGSRSEVMWDEFRHTDDIDLVIVGDSLAEQSCDPQAIDAVLGSSAFNMATPSQSLQSSYLAVEEAIQERSVMRVVLGVELYQVYGHGDSVTGALVREKGKSESLQEQVHNWYTLARPEDWLNDPKWIGVVLFPWQVQHVPYGEVATNVRMRLDGTSLAEASEAQEQGWTYYGRGYGNYSAVFANMIRTDQLAFSGERSIKGEQLKGDRLVLLDDICDLCEENGVELVVFAPPLPAFHVIDAGPDYGRLSGELKNHLAERGVAFLDFNLAKDSVYPNQVQNFVDFEHSNKSGAELLSGALAQAIKLIEADEPVDDLFESYEEHLANIDGISMAVFEQPCATDDGISVELRVMTGTNVKYECRFLAKGPDDADFAVVRDYAEDTRFTFKPESHGLYTVKSQLRVVGEQDNVREDTCYAMF